MSLRISLARETSGYQKSDSIQTQKMVAAQSRGSIFLRGAAHRLARRRRGVVNTTAKYLARRVDWMTSKQLTPAASLSRRYVTLHQYMYNTITGLIFSSHIIDYWYTLVPPQFLPISL